MSHMTSSVVVGGGAAVVWRPTAPPSIHAARASGLSAAELAMLATPVNRAAKADRLAPARAQRSEETAATLENRDAATIYRDREGRVVFQADQLRTVTVISKGSRLHQLTVRAT